jgi:serine/threonine-protein kinase
MFSVGCFELVLLAAGAFTLVWLLRAGRISKKQLLKYVLLYFIGLVLLGLLLGSMRRPHQAKAIVALILISFGIAVIATIAWLLWRWLRRTSLGAKIKGSAPVFGARVHAWLDPAFRGAPRAACPPFEHLKDLLADRLPTHEQARLAAHLEHCKTCQYRVEGLTAGQKSWPGMARKLSAHRLEPEPALQKVMERLKDNPEPEATSDEPVFAADLPLGFLSPSDKPGLLGRLERYEVQEEIGRGGMGIVLKAFDPSLHRVVAIKVLAPQLATSGVARKRFLREAKAAAAVTHDHIVTIHAVDEANGLPYLVMQYIAGQSLQDRIDKEGPLELTEILRIGIQTASGLAAAHGQGIVHRDIKPANILLEEGVQRVKITDFGLARAMDDASLTQSGFVAGSPLYMAPEQARGEALDHRADLFSLGSVLYTMCTGRPPFRAANTLAVLRRVSEDTPRPIRETNPEIPDWLAALIEKLMAKQPAERYQSANEVVEQLGQHLAQLQHAAWVPPPRSPAPAGAAEPGLPTSLTICPSCGANLQVPEKMVGSIVHCAECGKPFHVEEGSEVIQVARAVPPPFGPRPRARRRIPRWVWIVGGCAALLLLFIICGGFVSYSAARRSMTTMDAKTSASPRTTVESYRPPIHSASSWKNTLPWLPGEATLFGAIDFQHLGPLTLDDARTQTMLRLLMPKETTAKLTPENLGRIQLDGIAIAYYEDAKSGDSHILAHLEGVALDGHKRIIDFLRQEAGGQIQMEKNVRQPNQPTLVSAPQFPFALGIFDDNHVFLAASGNRNAAVAQHRLALEHIPGFNVSSAPRNETGILTGYNPPWIKAALLNIPPNACGMLLGEIPAAGRKWLCDTMKLRVCPRSFVLHLTRQGGGIGVSLRFNVDKTGTEKKLQEDLDKWRRRALSDWLALHPTLRLEPKARNQLSQTLNSVKFQIDRGSVGSVRADVTVPDATWRTLAELMKGMGQ